MRMTLYLLIGALCLTLPSPAQPRLKADANEILYSARKPKKGTPQAVLLEYFFLRESGKVKKANAHLSKDLPDWLRESLLKPQGSKDNPYQVSTLRYQLRVNKNSKKKPWLLSLSYNLKDGLYKGETRYAVWEDDRWKIR